MTCCLGRFLWVHMFTENHNILFRVPCKSYFVRVHQRSKWSLSVWPAMLPPDHSWHCALGRTKAGSGAPAAAWSVLDTLFVLGEGGLCRLASPSIQRNPCVRRERDTPWLRPTESQGNTLGTDLSGWSLQLFYAAPIHFLSNPEYIQNLTFGNGKIII